MCLSAVMDRWTALVRGMDSATAIAFFESEAGRRYDAAEKAACNTCDMAEQARLVGEMQSVLDDMQLEKAHGSGIS